MSIIKRKTKDEILLENQVKSLTCAKESLDAKLEYVAMMTDVDIEPHDGGDNV